MVNQGLRPAALVWAFTATHSNNWHPVTSISHMLDCSLFGLAPGPMHWENVTWHLLTALLVFLVWQSATGAAWPSAMVAGLFALHPAHVESVAWISERKDVLSAFFWLLGLAAFLRYARAPSVRTYLPVALLFVLALLCKPMAVTFPFTLLIFDWWPLRRPPAIPWRRLIAEKIPLFALALAHALVTLAVQVSTGASRYGQRFPLSARLGNAVVSLVRYLGKCLWPSHLAPHYAHPGWWPPWAVASAAISVGILSLLAWRQRTARPWLLFGWLWFLVTLLPVIGIIQVGAQAMADRYTYLPFLGLFTAAVWTARDIELRYRPHRLPRRLLIAAASLLLLALCATFTLRQASAWKDSITLYQRAIAAGTDNATLRYLLASAFQRAGYPSDAVAAQFHRAIALDPDYANAYTQLALLAANRHDFPEAERLVRETIRIDPLNPAFPKNLGVLRKFQARPDESAALFRDALRLDPSYLEANHELAWLALQQGDIPAAARELETVVRGSPWDYAALCELGVADLRLGRLADAQRCFERAAWVNPKFPDAASNLRLMAGMTR